MICMKGRLIVIEGIDGAGGETQSKKMLQYLQGRKIQAERVYYPDYGNPFGDLIHEYLHKKYEFNVNTQFLLYALDMVKDRERILGWLNQGKIVIADRYFTSTIAYQGLRLPIENALKFAEIFRLPKPDMILYLKVSPEISIKRKKVEKRNLDRNEENKAFLENVSKSYESLVKNQTWGSWFVIDGEKSIEQVFSQIKKVLRV
ncbi:MAG: dTMP kinase [Candidatus Aenigmarchaeota archaeon]|nr:dTMP kinase [Candidatus Aenigmarchaeota archaeon]